MSQRRSRPAKQARVPRPLLRLEWLEDRIAPTVFGFDDRVPIPTSQLHNPVNNLGAIQINPAIGRMFLDRDWSHTVSGDDAGVGTVFLIGRNYALTAAHCVYQTDSNGNVIFAPSARQILLAFGYDGQQVNVGVAGVSQVFVNDTWRSIHGTGVTGMFRDEWTKYDYALLKLDQNIGDKAQAWFKPIADPAGAAYGMRLYSAGYPSDKHGQQVETAGRTRGLDDERVVFSGLDVNEYNPSYAFILRQPGEAQADYQRRIQGYYGTVEQYEYTTGLDIYPGQSGSPVWFLDDTGQTGSRYNVVGIISNGFDPNDTGYASNTDEDANFAAHISYDVIAQLNSWIGLGSGGFRGAVIDPPSSVSDRPIMTNTNVLFGYQAGAFDGNYRPGDAISLSFPVYNRGYAYEPSLRVHYVLSTDDTIDANDPVMQLMSVPDTGPDSAQTSRFTDATFTVPNLPSGTYKVGWVIDSDGDPGWDRGVFPGSITIQGAGTAVTLTASVTASGATPTGSVTLLDGTTPLATIDLDGSGNASTSQVLGQGSHSITAVYHPTGNFLSSTSNPPVNVNVVTNEQSTTTTLASSAATVDVGTAVTLSASVTASGATPSGSVTFKDGTTTLATVNLDSSGTASTSQQLGQGSHSLTAVYNPTGNFTGSSASLIQTVNYPSSGGGGGGGSGGGGSGGGTIRASGIGAYDAATGTWYLRNETNAGAPDAGQFAYGLPGWYGVVGDWDGNGSFTVGVVDTSTGHWYLRNSNSAGPPDAGDFLYGLAGWIPVVGDWDGDGRSGIGIYDPLTGTWYLRNGSGPGVPDAGQFAYGALGWLPVVGDWTHSGHTGIGVVDPTTATWYLRSQPNAGEPDVPLFSYGSLGWKVAVGDWDGNGTFTPAVFDPFAATWYIRNSNSGGSPDVGQFAYGLGSWIPVAGTWTSSTGAAAAAGRASRASALQDAGSEDLLADALRASVRRTRALDALFTQD